MKKKIFPLITTAAMCAVFAVRGATTGPVLYSDGIVAIVNNEVITVSNVLRQTVQQEHFLSSRLGEEEYRQRVNQLRRDALENLISSELLAAEFEERGYKLPDAFIADQMDAIVANETNGDWDEFLSRLQDDGLTLQKFEENIRRRLAADALFDEEVRRRVFVAEDDLKQYYFDNKASFVRADAVMLRLLLISSEQRDEAAMRGRLELIAHELDQGVDFAEIARKYSDHVSAAAAGDLGWVGVAELNPQFNAYISKAETGMISPPIVTSEVIFLLMVEDRGEAKLLPFAAVRGEVEKMVRERKQQERFAEFIEYLRGKFYVKKFI